jgi:D-erythrulose 1-phosphate 3-epimerase
VADIVFGANTCFAVKRWPRVEDWAPLAAGLGLDTVQFSFDLLDPGVVGDARAYERVRTVCEAHGVRISSAFTGFVAYAQNLLGHPDAAMRAHAERWFGNAVRAAAALGARAVGGHVAAMTSAEVVDPAAREASIQRSIDAVLRIAETARAEGLQSFLWEAMPVAREYPSSIAEALDLARRTAGAAVPVRLCIDLGHACRAGAGGDDRDPYAWLVQAGAAAACIHLQQTDGRYDRHWAFTREHDAEGIVDPARVVALARGLPQDAVELMLEVLHPFEAPDGQVLDDMRESVRRWQAALAPAPQAVAVP